MNKKLTKLLSVFLIAGAVGTGAAGISACGGGNNNSSNGGGGHSHSAATEWQSDANGHWHNCTANDGYKFDEGAHVDADKNGKCDVCDHAVGVAVSITGVEASASKTQATVGDTIELTATVSGTGDYNKTVYWAITAGADKATLNGATLTVTGVGTVKVQATANGDNTQKSAEIAITVSAAQSADAITVPYTGPAAGPVAGSGETTSTFNTSSNIGAPSTLAEDYTKGVFTIKAGSEVRARARTGIYSEDASSAVDANAKFTHSVKNGNIVIDAPAAGTLTLYAENGSSSSFAKFKIDGITTEYVFKAASGKVVQITFDVPAAGTYTFAKTSGTVDIYQMDFTFQAAATPYESIELVSKGTTDYLVTQKLDCTGVAINAIDGNGIRHEMSLSNCEFDTSKYNPAVAGEYEVGVTLHLASNLTSDKLELKSTYTVKVYQVESISLYTMSFASNKQSSLQQACVTGDTFSKDNLTVMAKCKLGNDTIDFKLKNDWVTVSTPDLTTPGKKTVQVSVGTDYTVGNKEVKASYDLVVMDKKDVVDDKVELTVGENGDFATLTQAVQYLKACNYSSSVYKVIKLAAGTYTEKVWLDVDNVTLIGQGATMDDTVVSYSAVEDTVDLATGNKFVLYCATMHVTGKNFKAYNLSIRNDFDYINEASKYGSPQGLALTIAGDGAVLYKTHLYGNQDTLYLKNRAYFYQSQIDGNVDFIFGEATGLAYFDECKIVAINRSATDKGTDQNGYVTAMKADSKTKPNYGYIFNKCEFTDDGHVADGSMSLGRPWGASATVAYINCSFTKAYATSGYGSGNKTDRWSAMSGNLPANADFCEFGSTGEGAISEAVAGGSILTAEQAANYTKANIFAATNGLQSSTVFDCDTEYTKLRVLAGLESGEMPEETTKTVDLFDTSLTNGNCVADINAKYGEILTWEGTGSFQATKPENGVKVGLDTVITFKIVGEVTVAPGYFLTDADYIIIYKEGKATIKITAISGTYGDFIGSLVIDTAKTPADTQVVTVTIDYNDGETANGSVEAVVGLPLGRPADPVRAGYKFIGWQVNGTDYDFSANVEQAFTLVAQWEAQDNLDLTAGGTVNLYEFTTGTLQGTSGEYRGIIVDATAGKFAPRSNDVQVNEGVKIKFKINSTTTADQITVTFTAAAGDQYVPTCDVAVEEIEGQTYAVLTLGGGYPSTMTVVIA